MKITLTKAILLICGLLFITAIWGSVSCGISLSNPDLSAAEATVLRHLIYLHFGLSQIALVGAALTLYLRHRRWRKYYLLVSYNEKGLQVDPPGIRMPAGRVFRCHLGNICRATLPPPDAPILVYPMFMLSGHSSGTKLAAELTAAYATDGTKPRLFYQPVLGASPWLATATAEYIKPMLTAGTGVLVVAHGSCIAEPPPEPALFCRRLRELLPGTEVALGYFSQQPAADTVLHNMHAEHVLLLPFLLTEGLHTTRDLPTAQTAAACGKSLTRLPVVAALLSSSAESHA
ncbi:MAG: CbiX/SirB N-terminal domain-containing protein [Akkermansia sp.]|nr:CbiX/SirB N-terminal domain-containing protein [Akkermansia sp.]